MTPQKLREYCERNGLKLDQFFDMRSCVEVVAIRAGGKSLCMSVEQAESVTEVQLDDRVNRGQWKKAEQ